MNKYIKNALGTKRTRYRISIIAGVYLMALSGVAVFMQMEGLASACVAGILTILSTYIYGETKRPSNTDYE